MIEQDGWQALCLAKVMCRQHDSATLRGKLFQPVPDIGPCCGIEAGGRLIEQEQRRRMQDAGGKLHAPRPAARQRAEPLPQDIANAVFVRKFADGITGPAKTIGLGTELQIFLYGQIG